MRALIRLHQERSKINKKSVFRIRNRQIDLQETIRYFSRKRKSIEDLDPTKAPAIASAVRCLSPFPHSLESPTELETIERALLAAKSFTQGYYDGASRSKQNDTHYFANFARLAAHFHFGTHLVEDLFSDKAYQEGGQALLATTSYSKAMMEVCNPPTLVHILILLEKHFSPLRRLCLVCLNTSSP